jgi:hypothetical protein
MTVPVVLTRKHGSKGQLMKWRAGNSVATVSAASKALNCVLTCGTHGFSTGDIVTLSGFVTGMLGLNGLTVTINVKSSTEIYIGVDTTNEIAWNSGGSVTFVGAGIPIKSFEYNETSPESDATTAPSNGWTDVTSGNLTANVSVQCLWDEQLAGAACPTQIKASDEVTLRLYPSDGGGYFSGLFKVGARVLSVRDTDTVSWSFTARNKGIVVWVPAT